MPTQNGYPIKGEVWEKNGQRVLIVARTSGKFFDLVVLVARPEPLAPIQIPIRDAWLMVLRGDLCYVGPGPEMVRKKKRKVKKVESQLDKIIRLSSDNG